MVAEPTLERGVAIGAYVVEERIGAGGFGEVFRARHPVIGSEVAIKVLHPRYSADADAVARFVAEARAVNQISHPGIIEIFDFGELADGREYFVMELLVGRSLRDILRERSLLPLVEALPILRGIAEAVDAAHVANIAHRDLKPDNVYVLDDGRVKLIDFGLAKLTNTTDAPVTQTGTVFGTPMFMSPEQCRGRDVDTRTDLYSFGVLAYQLLAGVPPFEGDALSLALHHLNDVPLPPSHHRPELPTYVDRAVFALLAKDPADRPAPLSLAIRALEGAIKLRRRRRRLWLGIAMTAAVGTLIAVGATRKRGAVDDCAPASDRLAQVWTAQIADAAAPAFAIQGRPGVASSWKAGRAALDGLAAQWSEQWDAACHADRAADPLLYGQRIACLDNALLDLKNTITSITSRPADYVFDPLLDAGTGGRVLEDCANADVLRAQVPPPPVAVRGRVTALLGEVSRAADAAALAITQRRTVDADRDLATLAQLATDLEKLDPPSAASAILRRADLASGQALDIDATRLVSARAILDDAIVRIEAARDDVALAEAYVSLAWFEERAGDLDAMRRANEALARADIALRRAGSPIGVRRDLLDARASILVSSGQLVRGIAVSRESLALAAAHHRDDIFAEHILVAALALHGDAAQASRVARDIVADRVARFGESAELTAVALYELARALDQQGDTPGYLATLRRYDAIVVGLGGPQAPHHGIWGHAYKLESTLRAGGTDPEADAVVTSLAGKGTTPAGQNADGIATARRAGMFSVFAYGATRPDLTDPNRLADHRATLAFERGEPAPIACTTGCTGWVAFSRWLAVPAKDVERRFAELEAEYPGGAALANSGIVLASLGRWGLARPKLEAARAKPYIWELQADLVELDAWLALARLHDHDKAGARPLLVEALMAVSIWRNGVAGFTYMTPVANLELATLVWDEGDRDYARVLATRARDGFIRLGNNRDDAARWLAAD